jgi:hypothetical protein
VAGNSRDLIHLPVETNLSHRVKKTAAAEIILGWTIGANGV